MMRVFLEAVGVVARGLRGWDASRAVLAGESAYEATALATFDPDFLPANERRRITPTIRVALQAASEALQNTPVSAHEIGTVFASECGDLTISDRICSAAAAPGHPVSPTDFHNSVHNAPAGYWAIGNACRSPSTSVSAGSASFAAGLVEAATQLICDRAPVLLVCYDEPPPDALADLWHVDGTFAVALLLRDQRHEACIGTVTVEISASEAEITPLRNAALRPLLQGNGAAQCLPLLEMVARGETGRCRLHYVNGMLLNVEFVPC